MPEYGGSVSQDDSRSAEYLREARERIRRRRTKLMSRVIVPFFLLIWPIAFVGGSHALYMRRPDPADDLRNSPEFWTALTIGAYLIAGVIFFVWIRRIRNGKA
jgi:hypothetical protein